MQKAIDNLNLFVAKFSITLVDGTCYKVNEWYEDLDGRKFYACVHYDTLGIILSGHNSSKEKIKILIPWTSIVKIEI